MDAETLIRSLEFAGTEAAYCDQTANACPACGAIKPDERRSWGYFQKGDPMACEDGPRHEPDCPLGAFLDGLRDAEAPTG